MEPSATHMVDRMPNQTRSNPSAGDRRRKQWNGKHHDDRGVDKAAQNQIDDYDDPYDGHGGERQAGDPGGEHGGELGQPHESIKQLNADKHEEQAGGLYGALL